MSLIVQTLLLGACAILCLPPGDAVLCRVCVALNPGGECLSSGTCVADPKLRICHSYKVSKRGVILQKILGCRFKQLAHCARETIINGVQMQHRCCEDRDFCNEDL